MVNRAAWGYAPSVSDRPIRILIAEDHAFVREGTRRLLDMEPDMEVVGEAVDGIEAVDLVQRLRPSLVLMDVAMPRLDGIEATRQIRSIMPRTPVLVLTAYDDDQYVFSLLDAGAAGYLLKDVDRAQLVAAIRAVVRGESPLHPEIAKKVLRRMNGAGGKTPRVANDALSDRELEILRLAAVGLSNSAIADQLSISARTVQTHLSHIFDKLAVGSRTQAVITALRRGWFELRDLES